MHKNRITKATIAAATLLGALTAVAAPASAATYAAPAGYTYQLTSYQTWYGTRYLYRLVPVTQTAPVNPTTTAPAPTPTTTTTASMTAEEQQMLNLVNAERAKSGLAPLKADATLTKMARVKSQDMITNHYFAHQSPTYGSPFDMMKTFGVTYRSAGENIAGNQSVTAAFQAWMNSSGHRANILGSQYNYTGIGIVHGGPYGIMFTQEFVGR
ncbi:MAG TPA: CAP domain-containing protein [Symbiobacteriaceae bacterium]|nr:CAP domain-containing protein [Symbiobacteriaceae bacterium]